MLLLSLREKAERSSFVRDQIVKIHGSFLKEELMRARSQSRPFIVK
jgi:hypothetical protein